MRRFKILDALLLTASVAFAFALNHWLNAQQQRPETTLMKLFEVRLVVLLVTSTITWTLGGLVVADKTPLAIAFRSPGKLALLLITAASMVAIPMNWDQLFHSQISFGMRLAFLPFSFCHTPSIPACVTITGWLALRVANQERPTSDWLNVSGIAIGMLWILYAIAHPLFDLEVMRLLGVSV